MATNPAEFVRQVRQEAARTTWPTRKETMLSVVMALVLSGLAAGFFLLTDAAVAAAIRWILAQEV